MNITYIGHSGFYVELEHCALLFDYCRGTLPTFDFTKPLYVFISHHHGDHFSPMLFPLFRGHPSVTFVLSDDIERRYSRTTLRCLGVTDAEYEAFRFVAPGRQYHIQDLDVETLPSTDEGVAFIVQTEGKTIYHAGDLHLWLWPRDTEQWNLSITRRFQEILEPLRGRHFDVAFLPIDPRQEEDYYKGFDYFMRLTDTDEAYPMHFWDQEDVIDRFYALPCTEPYRDRIRRAERSNPHVKLFSSFEF
ncbi:MAG TPA: MBL fold metallo-hydrolase [Candidatus Onthomonas avicola]|nr:MBL fold metallo-hydrolase [Candidatus Onthomonas avicola]